MSPTASSSLALPVRKARRNLTPSLIRTRLALTLCFICIGAAAPPSSWAAGSSQGTGLEDYLKRLGYEPIEITSNERHEPLIEGDIGGRRKRQLLVDTGCRFTLLDTRSAAGLKTLGELGVVLEDNFLGPITNAAIVLIDKLVLGRAQFLNQPARAQKLEMDYIQVPRDAILGCDFFFRNFCLVDCGAQRLYVRGARPSRDQSRALTETLRRSGFVEVPLPTRPGLNVEAKVNGQPLRLIVDTGAPFTQLDESQLKSLGLSVVMQTTPPAGSLIPEEAAGQVVGVGKIGAHKLRVTTVKNFQIGAKTWQNIHLGVTNLKAWGLLQPGTGLEDEAGLLGRDLLAGQGALIDFASRKLWFRP